MQKRQKKVGRNRIRLIWMSVVLIGAVSVAVMLTSLLTEENEKDVIFRVAGESVGQEELQMFLDENRFRYEQIIQENQLLPPQAFSEKGEAFWRAMTACAKDDLVRVRSNLQAAEEKGAVKWYPWQELKGRWTENNRERKEALEKGEVIYGLTEFSLYDFYQYEYSERMNELKRLFCESCYDVGKQELRDFYEKSERPAFLSGESRTFSMCRISLVEAAQLSQSTTEEKREWINSRKKEGKMQDREIQNEELNRLRMEDRQWEKLSSLRPNEMCVLQIEGEATAVILTQERKAQAFSESDWENLRRLYAEVQCEEYLRTWYDETEVVICNASMEKFIEAQK